MPAVEPPAALRAWAASIPATRCAPASTRAWTGAADSNLVPVTKTAHFGDRGTFSAVAANGLKLVARGHDGFVYLLGVVPSTQAIVMHVGSEPEETSFTAEFADAPAPPHAVATLPAAPRTQDGLGLGSPRAAVEASLGPAKASSLCGYDVVRYEPAVPEASVGEEWFVYSKGRVVAFARYEAV